MAEYLPLREPGDRLPMTAGTGGVTGGQAVYVSAARTVRFTAGANKSFLGIAANDAAAGALVTVICGGVHRVTASGTIAAGDLIESAAAGAVATHTLGTNDGNVIGKALTAATDGTAVEVYIN